MKRQYKWIAFLIAFVLMFALGVEITPLSERAIVAGLALDYVEGRYLVSCQILLPSSDDSKSSGIVVSSASGSTIGEALERISAESSMLIAMSHCNLVLLGEGVVLDKAYTSLDYMVRNAYLSENALLLTTEGLAKDVLSAKTAYSDMTSFYIQRELMVYGNYREAVRRNIKEFLASYYTHNSANWLTKVSKIEAEKPQTGGSSESSGSTGGSSSEEDKVYVFDFTKCSIIKGNSLVFEGNAEVISGINFVNEKLDKGDVVVTDGEVSYCFYIISSQGKLSFTPKEYTAKAKIRLDLVLKEVIAPVGVEYSVPDVEPPERVAQLVKDYVAHAVTTAYEECKKQNVDIFNLYGGFYGKEGKEWLEHAENYLEKSKMETEIKVKYY